MPTMTFAEWLRLPMAWRKRDEQLRCYRLVFVPCYGWEQVQVVHTPYVPDADEAELLAIERDME